MNTKLNVQKISLFSKENEVACNKTLPQPSYSLCQNLSQNDQSQSNMMKNPMNKANPTSNSTKEGGPCKIIEKIQIPTKIPTASPNSNPTKEGGPCKILETKQGQKIVNLSDLQLNPSEISILSKGLKFCPTQTKKDPGENKRELEEFHRKIRTKEFFSKIPPNQYTIPKSSYDISTRPSTEETETIGNLFPFDRTQDFVKLKQPSNWRPPKGSNNLETFITMNEISTQGLNYEKNPTQNLTPAERSSIKVLSRNKELTIKEADKGGSIVLMNTRDYVKEAERQLSDTNTYKPLDRDATSENNNEIIKQVDKMVENGDISAKMVKYLINPNPRTAQIYFLPKIHKNLDNPPGRPIVSASGCPTEKIISFCGPLP